MAVRPLTSHAFTTNHQRLDHAIRVYWQRRFPGKAGRVLIVVRDQTNREAA